MFRSVVIVTSGTLGSRLTGFIRDALIAALLGAGAVADAFLIAFQAVTLVRRLLTEGALNAAFVPAWLQVRRSEGADAAARFAGRALGTIGLGVVLVAVLLGVAAPLVIAMLAPGFAGTSAGDAAVTSARLMLPYLAFAGPVAVMIALANAQRRVAISSAAPLLFNLSMIAACAILLWQGSDAPRAAWIVAATVGLAGLLQLVMVSRAGADASPLAIGLDPSVRALIGRALPGMVASAGPQLMIVAGAVVASREPSAVSWLYFASRLIDFPLGIVSAVSGAVLVTEAAHAARDPSAARRATAHGMATALAFALPASIGLIMLADPIVQAVFKRGAFAADDARQTALALQWLALGLPAQALVKALAPSFYAKGDTYGPMTATLAGAAVTLLAALATRELAGIAAAIAIGSGVNAGLLLLKHGAPAAGEMRLMRIVIAAVAMGVAVFALRAVLPPDTAVRLAVLIVLGLVAYAGALVTFGAIRPHDLRAAWARRGLREQDTHGTRTPNSRQDISK
jgi:putative peptidoglycan lipid II flippase